MRLMIITEESDWEMEIGYHNGHWVTHAYWLGTKRVIGLLLRTHGGLLVGKNYRAACIASYTAHPGVDIAFSCVLLMEGLTLLIALHCIFYKGQEGPHFLYCIQIDASYKSVYT